MLTKTLPKTLLTKTQSPGFFFPGLLMAFIMIWPINRLEAQMKVSVAKTDMAQTTGQMLNRENDLGKNIKPVERPGPQKPKRPVIAHYPMERF